MARQSTKSPIHSRKHIIGQTVYNVGLGAINQIDVVHAVERTTANAAQEVTEGSIVKAIYVEHWVTSDDAAAGSQVLSVEKIPSSGTPMTYAQSIALDSYPNKKNIFFTSQGLVAPNVSTPLPVIRQWVEIPKGKQRMGLGDKIVLNLSGITNGVSACGLFIYKEYE